MLSDCKATNTCKDKKKKQSVPVLKKYLEKLVGHFDVKRKHIKQVECRAACVYLKNHRFSCSETTVAFIQVSPHQCGEIWMNSTIIYLQLIVPKYCS